MMRTPLIAVACAAALIALAACGGGGGGSSPSTMAPERPMEPQQPMTPEPEVPEQVQRLPLPIINWHGGVWALPEPVAGDARHAPIYRSNGRTLWVGVDQGTDTSRGTEHIGNLPTAGKRDDIEIRYGRLNDGAGRNNVQRYLSQAGIPAPARRMTSPLVRVVGPASASDIDQVIAAVQLVNAALPEGSKLRLGEHLPFPGSGGVPLIEEPGVWVDNTIAVQFVTRRWFMGGASAGAVTVPFPVGPRYAYVQFNTNSNSYGTEPETVTLLAHELMHSIGIRNHVSSDFATIMEDTSAIHHGEQNGQRLPLSLLYPVDREALRALYGRLANSNSPANLGPWSSYSTHLLGNGEHANFGVAFRNGYAEPWANGYTPDNDLAHNAALSGTVSWEGALVGFTPAAAAVAGDAEIGVNLGTLTGRADFTELEEWAGTPRAAGTGTTWLDGDLGYTIAVMGNTFRETGGDAGRLTGIFTGRSHEGVAGTLERSDLTAAFGASR